MAQTELAARVLGHDVAREVRLDLIRSEAVNRTLIHVADLTDEVSTLLDELTLGLLVQLMVELALELLQLYDF